MSTTETAAGLRRLADFIDANPGVVADELAASFDWPTNVPVSSSDDPKGALAAIARAAVRAGYPVSKDFSTWAGVTVDMGGFRFFAYAARSQVCEKVVKGTREVTKEIPDPSAPKIAVTETVEDVEWICKPLLDVAS